MAKQIDILAAGCVKDILFRTNDAFDIYISLLKERNVVYKILETFERSDGCVIIRIVQQYNNSPLIQLYSEGSE